jgi:mono/diheme cytochrome c family protein/heme/copper-type cytochrome/quinol oxidase subunit 4
MSTHTSAPGHHEEHAHRPVSFYLLIAAFLSVITFIEIGPLFEWYNLPAEVLLVMSVVKFFTVVFFFMHLWDDSKVFTQVFMPALFGAGLMVLVLMLLFWGYAPSPRTDSVPVQEAYWTDYSGECQSWLRSHISNRWYCASPALDEQRILTAYKPAEEPKKALDWSVDGKSPEEAKALLVEKGKGLYEANCQACHQPTGAGVPPAFPPLAGSDFIDDPGKHIQIVLKGLNGPITVKGVNYNGNMVPFASLQDAEIAAIITYERNSWGNEMGVVMPEAVAKAR